MKSNLFLAQATQQRTMFTYFMLKITSVEFHFYHISASSISFFSLQIDVCLQLNSLIKLKTSQIQLKIYLMQTSSMIIVNLLFSVRTMKLKTKLSLNEKKIHFLTFTHTFSLYLYSFISNLQKIFILLIDLKYRNQCKYTIQQCTWICNQNLLIIH